VNVPGNDYLVFGRFGFRVGILTYLPLGTVLGIGGGSIWAFHFFDCSFVVG
jgi:hypothetical protein